MSIERQTQKQNDQKTHNDPLRKLIILKQKDYKIMQKPVWERE
ncbi:hypothetical protein NitYY0814_C1587 [Nitratiruptor sp. YY08-14]|nr:hypothetical protein NitYY0810_C1579 [Nitratiruptor sp. YY08-10]BCD64733.1 hypothetical protein NitYY0814_C1587 [Nitratiruptor sp. YY08-14]